MSIYEYNGNELGFWDSCRECGQDTGWVPAWFGPHPKPTATQSMLAQVYEKMIREELERPLLFNKFWEEGSKP